jgi:hypothetical protein
MFSIKKQELQELVNKGLTDTEIGNIYNVSQQVIYYHRLKVHKLNRKSLREHIPYNLTSIQLEVIFGCVLGDGNLKNRKYDLGTTFTCQHSLKQKDYVKYKKSYFPNLGNIKDYVRLTPNKITNKIYSSTVFNLKVNKNLNYFYNEFYKENGKIIPINLLEKYYTPLAMAIHYMDDGSKVGTSAYQIHTCSFTKKNINEFRDFLKDKYNLNTSLHSLNRLYIKNSSKETFRKLIEPYICNSMLYKL